MTVRSIKASEPCASTFARLDGAITVARTDNATVLYNLPRDIGDIDSSAGRPGGIAERLRSLFR
ncbi:hypothetical protein [Corynebacterium mayonis]|uniref:hypothetical protein n=1 Tax=Corynebacterium mayonis TaxID=3062461 RepID=UPI0031405867